MSPMKWTRPYAYLSIKPFIASAFVVPHPKAPDCHLDRCVSLMIEYEGRFVMFTGES